MIGCWSMHGYISAYIYIYIYIYLPALNLVVLQRLYWVTACFIFVCQLDASRDPWASKSYNHFSFFKHSNTHICIVCWLSVYHFSLRFSTVEHRKKVIPLIWIIQSCLLFFKCVKKNDLRKYTNQIYFFTFKTNQMKLLICLKTYLSHSVTEKFEQKMFE